MESTVLGCSHRNPISLFGNQIHLGHPPISVAHIPTTPHFVTKGLKKVFSRACISKSYDDGSFSSTIAEGYSSKCESLGFRKCECHDRFRELVPYVEAWAWQKLRVEERVQALKRGEDMDDCLVVLQHPPVYTLGTRSSNDFLKFDFENPPFELHRTERGGEVTYHGPGQLVMYPILNLRHHQMDLHWYLRSLEEVVIRALWSACEIRANRIEGLTGVWVGHEKVAAIGVRVSRWITYHGLALNVSTNLAPFANIVPCGIANYSVTSLSKLLEAGSDLSLEHGASRYKHPDVLVDTVHQSLLSEFSHIFQVELVPHSSPRP
ncbi:unnamed protein product [Sphagnum balticum]